MADRPDIESGHLTAAHVAMLLDRAADDLTRRLGDVFSPETIREVVQQSYDLLDATAQVRTTCPCWLAASPATACRPSPRTREQIVTSNPEVLFVCVHNAGRSQMAAALLAHHGQGRVVVRSAGSAQDRRRATS